MQVDDGDNFWQVNFVLDESVTIHKLQTKHSSLVLEQVGVEEEEELEQVQVAVEEEEMEQM